MRSVLTALMLTGGAIGLAQLEWYWIILALVYTVVINDIFCHRICSHGMFAINTGSWVYKILTFLASADMGYGPVKWIVVSHPLHHIHSDKGPEDVMNWRYHWYSTTIVSPLPRKDVKPNNYAEYVKNRQAKCAYLLNDPWTSWCCDHQNAISLMTMCVLAVFAPTLLLIVFTGRLLLSVMTGLAGFCGHIKNFPLSYRNFDTNDTTSNNLLMHYLFLGMFAGMLQNNHHGQHNSIRPNSRWFEFDTSYYFVTTLKHLIEKK